VRCGGGEGGGKIWFDSVQFEKSYGSGQAEGFGSTLRVHGMGTTGAVMIEDVGCLGVGKCLEGEGLAGIRINLVGGANQGKGKGE